ncbi:MAG: RpiB/LacA/LacB family sugar-phosphate isomerase [Patescibacteria group bacterium]
MKIYLASDHAGFELKNHLIGFLNAQGYTAIDKGPFSHDPNDDYPDYVSLVAEEILKEPNDTRGIILGGSGQGEAMTVNRFKRIRAAVYYGGSEKIVKISREDNNSNILSLGARFLKSEEAESAVKLWLETAYSEDERHVRRLKKIDEN